MEKQGYVIVLFEKIFPDVCPFMYVVQQDRKCVAVIMQVHHLCQQVG
jgi:hypothetical protein